MNEWKSFQLIKMFWDLIYSFAIPVIVRWVKLLDFLRLKEQCGFLHQALKQSWECLFSGLVGSHAKKLPLVGQVYPIFLACFVNIESFNCSKV